MKKSFVILVLAVALAFGSVCAARAVDVKVKGMWDFGIGWLKNSAPNAPGTSFYDSGQTGADNFQARQRLRTQIDIIASESLSGTVMFEIGTIWWGGAVSSSRQNAYDGRSSGGRLDADGVNVETKRAYLDWIVPDTGLAVRMGIQGLSMPSATGFMNPVYNADGAGIVASYKFNDTVSATVFWMRPFDAYLNDGENNNLDDEMDFMGLMVPLTFDGFKITPWAAYAEIGGASGFWAYRKGGASDGGFDNTLTGARNVFDDHTNALWAGIGVDISLFDPLSFRFDVNYGRLRGSADWQSTAAGAVSTDPFFNSEENPGSSGWLVDAILEYKLDWGVPGLFGWWGSGDSEGDVNAGKFGRMPVVSSDTGFGPTGFGTKSSAVPGFGYDSVISQTGVGTWGIGVQLKDFSFVEKLAHTVRFAYIRGTNDHEVVENFGSLASNNNPGRCGLNLFGDAVYMTDKDSAYEINFTTNYKLYDNLTVYLDTAWIKLDLSGDVWKKNRNGDFGSDTSDAWKAEFIFRYAF